MPTKNGLTLIEVAVSVVVLGIVSTTVAEVLQWSAAQHRAAERKRCALEIATTILDEFTVREWSTITPENAAKVTLPVEVANSLVEPHLLLQVSQEKKNGEGPESKRVSVEISWHSGASTQVDRAQLCTWVFSQKTGTGTKE